MCFSPEASFAGGIIISSIGIATISKVHKPSQIVFASIPLFFGIQQIAEGFLWLNLPYPESVLIQKISIYMFLVMADVIWPLMIPVAVLLMEENKRKKRILYGLLVLGLLLSSYYGYCLLFLHVTPQIQGYHIRYFNDFPRSMANTAFVAYLLATIPPLFISSVKRMHLLGVFMSLSCLVTAIFFTQYLTSVWCFFAALISGVVFWILSDSKKKFYLDKLLKLDALIAKVKSEVAK
jgi:hypothetical protein